MDLTILKQKPEKNSTAILHIFPLAPISLVSNLPGSYYRSQRTPSDHMLYGLLENLLGWHFDSEQRKLIFKDIQKAFKKEHKVELKEAHFKSESGYLPLIGHLVDFGLKYLPPTRGYDDYWTQHLKGSDKRHFDGVRNVDARVHKKLNEVRNATEKEQRQFMKEWGNQLPNFYSSPKRREYLIPEGTYQIQMNTNESFLAEVESAVFENNVGYLGNTEGWVHLEIERQ